MIKHCLSLILILWSNVLLCRASIADDFAKSSYYYPAASNKVDAENKVCCDGIPEGDREFVSSLFTLVSKYLGPKKNLTYALRSRSGVSQQLAALVTAETELEKSMSGLDEHGADVPAHLKRGISEIVREQVAAFTKLAESQASYDEFLKSDEAKKNSQRISGLWNLMLSKYDGMSQESRNSLLKILVELDPKERF